VTNPISRIARALRRSGDGPPILIYAPTPLSEADARAAPRPARSSGLADPADSGGPLQVLPGRLEIIDGPESGRMLLLAFPLATLPTEIALGRADAPWPHLLLRAPGVSLRHAALRFQPPVWSIRSLVRQQPVLVNDAPLLPPAEHTLRDRDHIRIGSVQLLFHARPA